MINDDVLIKYSISKNYGGYGDWVSHVKVLSRQIRDIRDNDFTGIGLDDLSLTAPGDVKIGDRIILCDYLDQNGGDQENASILGLVIRISPEDPWIIEIEIEGIGRRSDFKRDPERSLRWGTKIYPDLRSYPTLLRLDTKPRPDGGAVYYYFSKSPRDLRVNYLPGNIFNSKRAILGTLMNTAQEDLSQVRPRAQYMHTYRRVSKEIGKLLSEIDYKDLWWEDLRRLISGATSENSQEISKVVWEKLNATRN
ncbi:MAG: hypothetical protein K2N48_13325, partial [Muribaculaceae bacterium]|nr:hypothetical protein [Muribaculaceae bacterium]